MIAVHIGAGKFKKEEQEACRRQCENSCILGIELLKQNEVAEAVCHQVMRALESSDWGNLGSSANLTHNNKRMLEAGIYNVTENIYAGVAGISDSIYASDAAMNVYESQKSSVPSLIRPVIKWANKMTYEDSNQSTNSSNADLHDTAGVICIDNNGTMVVICSSGGPRNKPEDRIGPSAINGHGLAGSKRTHRSVSICTSGSGNFISTNVLAAKISDYLANCRQDFDGDLGKVTQWLQEAFYFNNQNVKDHTNKFGFLAVLHEMPDICHLMVVHNTSQMIFGYQFLEDTKPTSTISRRDAYSFWAKYGFAAKLSVNHRGVWSFCILPAKSDLKLSILRKVLSRMDNSVHDSNYRYAANKKLRSIVLLEEPALVAIQKYARNKVLDAYFVYVSLLGNHEFYMVFLPLSYWLGYSEVTATLVDILYLGVYLTGIMKDYFGSPRPSSPPLERLTLSHHIALEFGFPSTHTCNAFSVSLYIILECINLQTTSSASESLRLLIIILSIVYCFSVSFGRIYCGMHGFLDVGAGAALGIAITLLRYNFKDYIRNILLNLSLVKLLAAIMLLLVAIEKFPEPFTPCPCFKDCVSFLGVEMGLWLFAWLRPGRFGGDILDFQQMSSTKLIVRSIVGVALVLGWRISVSYIIKKVLSLNFAKSPKSRRSRPPQEFSSQAKSKLKNGLSRLDIAIKLFMYIGIGLTVTLVVPSVV